MKHARDRDIVEVVTGRPAQRPVLPPAGHSAVDQLWIVPEQLVGTKAESFHHARPVSLDQPVRARRQPAHERPGLFMLEIERNAAPGPQQGIVLEPDHPGRIDADHLGAMVGEHHAAEGTGTNAGKFDDPDALQRPGHDALLFLRYVR